MNKNVLILSAVTIALLFVIAGCSIQVTPQANSSNTTCGLNGSSCGGSAHGPVLSSSSNNTGNAVPSAADNVTVEISNTTSITNISSQISNGSNLINKW